MIVFETMFLNDVRQMMAGMVPTSTSSSITLSDAHQDAVRAYLFGHPFSQPLAGSSSSELWWIYNPAFASTIVAELDVAVDGISTLTLTTDVSSSVFTGLELGQLVRALPVETIHIGDGDINGSTATVASMIEREWFTKHAHVSVDSTTISSPAYMELTRAREWYRYIRAQAELVEKHPDVFFATPMLYREQGDPSVRRYVAWVVDNPSLFPPCELISALTIDRKKSSVTILGLVEPHVFTSVLPEHRLSVVDTELTYHVFDPSANPNKSWKIDLGNLQPFSGTMEMLMPSVVVSFDALAPTMSTAMSSSAG